MKIKEKSMPFCVMMGASVPRSSPRLHTTGAIQTTAQVSCRYLVLWSKKELSAWHFNSQLLLFVMQGKGTAQLLWQCTTFMWPLRGAGCTYTVFIRDHQKVVPTTAHTVLHDFLVISDEDSVGTATTLWWPYWHLSSLRLHMAAFRAPSRDKSVRHTWSERPNVKVSESSSHYCTPAVFGASLSALSPSPFHSAAARPPHCSSSQSCGTAPCHHISPAQS